MTEPNEKPILMCAPMVLASLDDTKTQTRRIVKPQPAGEIKRGADGFNQWYDTKYFERREQRENKGIGTSGFRCPYGQPGDRLWVKETFIDTGCGAQGSKHWNYITYLADGENRTIENGVAIWRSTLDKKIARQRKYCPPEPTDQDADDYLERYDAYHGWISNEFKRHRPSIFMPRWASRITLEITDVRVERLQDISEEDAKAEGLEAHPSLPLWKNYRPEPSKPYGPNMWVPFLPSARASYLSLWESINGEGSWERNDWVWVVSFTRIKP